MVTDELVIDEWLLRGPDGRPAGRLDRLGEQVWDVDIEGARRAVVHHFWCDVMACLPLAIDPTGWTASGDRWALAWTGAQWSHLHPSTAIPTAWACRPGPDSMAIEVLSPNATSVVAGRIGVLEAGIVDVGVHRLGRSRYFADGDLVVTGDGWADFCADLDEAAAVMADRLGIPLMTSGCAMRRRPRQITAALAEVGESISTWRRLLGLPAAVVADRAGVTPKTLRALENGKGSSLETLLRVSRALGITEQLLVAIDPMETDLGRARAEQRLPKRVRRPRP